MDTLTDDERLDCIALIIFITHNRAAISKDGLPLYSEGDAISEGLAIFLNRTLELVFSALVKLGVPTCPLPN